ncbi:MAG: purine-binding chemotaxis protein CheW [Betaproteobacteria bacterium]|nr:purine-binding chemotaxis protein CheW [Betaproteobacteria bacterium]
MANLTPQGAETSVVAGSPKLPATVDQAPAQYLTFQFGGELFALGILNVKEIIEYGTITEIPMMPAFIRGVLNLRGAVVPVIDLSARFGGVPTATGRRTCIVIIEMIQTAEGSEVRQDIGLVVDCVNEVLEIPASDIEPPPAFGAKIRADFIQGMGKVAGKFVIILSAERVLSVEEMSTLSQLSGQTGNSIEEGSAAR